LAKDAAYKINEQLTSIGAKANCSILEKAGNKLAHKLMAKLEQNNIIYDQKTNHGETQRAWIYMHL
jgi:predicted secreted Zn-dependent protease